jgi:hypothetical protein
MGELTVWPAAAASAATAAAVTAAASAISVAVGATGAETTGAAAGTMTCWVNTGATAPVEPLTIRTLPSASVISNSVTLESETKSIKVLSLRKSMLPPVFAIENAEFTLKKHVNNYKCSHLSE